MAYRPGKRLKKTVTGTGVVLLLAGLNAPAAIGFAEEQYHQYRISRPEYTAKYGSWQVQDTPDSYELNAIHATLLHTGKVLLIAGSGNEQEQFDAGTFRTVLWDPVENSYEEISTPADLFCAGHTQLADGRLLVAGGTARYELLDGDVERAGGRMLVKNENPDKPLRLKKGTGFIAPSGLVYRTTAAVTVPAAEKKTVKRGKRAKAVVTAAEANVFVEAEAEGDGYVQDRQAQYAVEGLTGEDADNVYGLAQKLTLDKQDFQGIKDTFEFDPVAERYVRVDAMDKARWYPTLVTLPDGKVLSVSGLDESGEILYGDNEIYDPRTRKWSTAPNRYFPTYPALFLTEGGKLFYSGANAGYGPADRGRKPGIWDLKDNSFTTVPGLTDPDQLETAASLLLPPAQDQKVMVLGGGGVGESPKATPRTSIIDLTQEEPAYEDGPSLPTGTRYLNSVIMPDDTVFTSGGSRDYRGRGDSDIHKAQFYDPRTNSFTRAADPEVGRNYHSEAVLLPDGRVAVFGSDPLFGDRANTRPGTFEKRIEIFTPPYLHKADDATRLEIGAGPKRPGRGQEATYEVAGAERVVKARLMRPGSVTHVTDVEQRSIQLDVERGDGKVTVTVPEDPNLVPPGWYMLFVADGKGVPSEAKWVHVP
ncbi:kelch motif-containing protein [Streptomyces sp. WMMC500]|uniref:kelch motif-containing protein n=1 Tax=Streptomyces sp. WMMC500 TaxID=3015154 RepID=UPI00248D0FA4|nr:kelch motif-containing protein [Streptomyces sp. WMMC500]WBB62987.1 kelch motif-containing protein [Streptomyces sp. WMMC500]